VPTVLKVSVVVPTYRSGDGLDRLVASLDAQTLSTDEFEVIFVDDGSPDNTHERLLRIAATRPHVRVERIENSGWPSRPRNVGTDLATGEYVAYMDHDDLLYPDALRAAYEFGVAHGADVVNGKEARTHDAAWAIELYRADEPQSIGREDQHPLIPMNPHKLYRLAFLREHGIRFREGGRVMWEDIFFNLLADRHARVISTLTSVPYYHWYMTPGSGSKGFLRSGEEFWTWLREVFTATEHDLAGPEHERSRDQLLLHQYRSRVLGSFNSEYGRRPAGEREHIYAQCRSLQQDFDLTRLDDRLNASARLRADLLAADRSDLLEKVAVHDPGIPGWGEAVGARFADGVLEVEVRAEWSSGRGRRHALRREGDRIVKDLPPSYLEAVAPAHLDVTEEIDSAQIAVGLRSRASRVTWMAPSSSQLDVVDEATGGVSFGGAATARIDPERLVFGRPLESGIWDLNVRCTLAGTSTQQGMRSALLPAADVRGGRTRLLYTTADDRLALSLDRPQDLVQRLRPDPARSSVETRASRTVVRVALEHAAAGEDGSWSVTVPVARGRGLRERIGGATPFQDAPATLSASGGEVVVELTLPVGATRVGVGALHPDAPRWWQVSDALKAGPAARTAMTPAVRTARLLRRGRKRLRRAVGRARARLRRL